MTVAVSLTGLPRMAPWRKGIVRLMDIVLHVGSHRTGSTSFQHYLRSNRAHLMAQGTALWEPNMLRKGLFTDCLPHRACKTGVTCSAAQWAASACTLHRPSGQGR